MNENDIPYERKTGKQPQISDRDILVAQPRPAKISVERVSRTTLYADILHMAAKQRDEIKQSLQGLEVAKNNDQDEKKPSDSDEWVNKSKYSDSVAKLVFDTEKKKKNVKKTK